MKKYVNFLKEVLQIYSSKKNSMNQNCSIQHAQYRVTNNAQTLEKALFSNLNLTKS